MIGLGSSVDRKCSSGCVGWWGEGVTRGVVRRVLGGVGGMGGECEACGRGMLLCVRLFGLVLCVRGWQRRFLF